jgi:hypothetical protein
MMPGRKQDTFKFEWPKEEIFIGKFLHLFILGGLLILLIWETFFGFSFTEFRMRLPVASLFFILPILLALYILFYFIISTFAYKIIFDFNNEIIESHIFKKKRPIIHEIGELVSVDFNWHTHFRFSAGKTVKTKADSRLVHFLIDNNIQRRWGPFSKLFMRSEYLKDLG